MFTTHYGMEGCRSILGHIQNPNSKWDWTKRPTFLSLRNLPLPLFYLHVPTFFPLHVAEKDHYRFSGSRLSRIPSRSGVGFRPGERIPDVGRITMILLGNRFLLMKRLIAPALAATLFVFPSCAPRPSHRHPSTEARHEAPATNPIANGQAVPSFHNPLPVTPRVQEMFLSCWATSGQMIMDFVGKISARQCRQTLQEYPGTCPECCDSNNSMQLCCSLSGLPQWDIWGFSSITNAESTPLAWKVFTDEIDGGRPMAFAWTREGPLHMVVAIGYDQSGTSRSITFLDPTFSVPAEIVMVPFSEYEAWRKLDNYGIKLKATGVQ
jgi:hypothetical protein